MKRVLAIAGLAVVAGCSGPAPTKAPPVVASAIPPAPAAGAPRSCVALSQIREARVVDDKTIDFYLGDRQVLRNNLPHPCPQLGFEKAFTYSTSLSQLCSVDIITVIIQGGGPRIGASCGLGMFAPYTPPAK